uniref:Uncharacterized protein n=1 Tax=Arion vulgaris TaxID=1028688 RepID=A0A0B7B8T8_9EUPU
MYQAANVMLCDINILAHWKFPFILCCPLQQPPQSSPVDHVYEKMITISVSLCYVIDILAQWAFPCVLRHPLQQPPQRSPADRTYEKLSTISGS